MPLAKKRAGNRRKPVDAAVGTLERGLAILQFFKSVPEASVAEVATALDLSRSTTYRIAERLRDLGFLETNSTTARWRLGRETVQLGVAALQSTDLMRIAPQILLSLLEGTREAVNLAVFDTDSMVLVYREQGPQSVTISSRLGSRRPMHASGLGKAYLAALRPRSGTRSSSDWISSALRRRLSSTRPLSSAELIEIQKRGFADDRREFEQTLACCAAAVFDHRVGAGRGHQRLGARGSHPRQIRSGGCGSGRRGARDLRAPGIHLQSRQDEPRLTLRLAAAITGAGFRGFLDVGGIHAISSYTGTRIPLNETIMNVGTGCSEAAL